MQWFLNSSHVCVGGVLPVPNPAGVTVRALAMNGVTVVAVFTGGTHFLAVFTKETLGAELITPRPVPASVAGNATPLCDLTGLLTFAVPTPTTSQGIEEQNFTAILLHAVNNEDIFTVQYLQLELDKQFRASTVLFGL